MEKRITLRIPIELDNLIQKEKTKRRISKNTLIVEACIAFISDARRKQNERDNYQNGKQELSLEADKVADSR